MHTNRTSRTPRSLQAEAEQHANDEHTRRLAELKTLAPLMAQLDALREPLAQAGLTIYPDQISLRLVSLSGTTWSAPRFKVLRIRGSILLHQSRLPSWHTALTQMGFRTVRHDAGSVFPTALLRKGTLLMEVDLSAAESEALAAAAQAQPEAVPA